MLMKLEKNIMTGIFSEAGRQRQAKRMFDLAEEFISQGKKCSG